MSINNAPYWHNLPPNQPLLLKAYTPPKPSTPLDIFSNHSELNNISNTVKGNWTGVEDEILKKQVSIHGLKKWKEIA